MSSGTQASKVLAVHHPTHIVRDGEPLVEAIARACRAKPVENQVMEAAQRAGRLAEALTDLADDLELEDRSRSQLARLSAYPLLVLHLIPLAVSTPLLVGDPAGFASRVVMAYGFLWALLGVLWLLGRGLLGSRTGLALLRRVPAIGRASIDAQLVRFLAALRWTYGSGVLWREAVPAAARCSGAVPLPEIEAAARDAEADGEMAVSLTRLGPLDADLVVELQTAAHVGGLENTLGRWVSILRERQARNLETLAKLGAGVLYAVAVGAVAVTAVAFYSGMLSRLS